MDSGNRVVALVVIVTVAVVAGALGFGLAVRGSAGLEEAVEQARLEGRREAQAAVAVQLAQLERKADALAEQLAEAEARLSALARTRAEAPAGREPATETVDQDRAAEVLQALGALARQASETGADDAPGDAFGEGPGGFMGMFEGEEGRRMADYAANMAVDMQYGELFTELGLDPATEEELRQLISYETSRGIQRSAEMMRGVHSPEEQAAFGREIEASLREQLSHILSPEQMDQFEEYQETLPQRMLSRSLDMQMQMMAPNMAPGTRDIVRDVVMEEMLVSMDPSGLTGLSGMPEGDPVQALEGQLHAIANAEARLETVLSDVEMSQTRRFLDAQRQNLEMARRMMGGAMAE